MNGAMFRGKIAQFRAVPYAARKRIKLPHKIDSLIDMSKETLEELAHKRDKPDEYLGKDMQFKKIKLNPDWESMDPADLSDEYESDPEPEEEDLGNTAVYDDDNPRRSKRTRT
jgi:hypothetical protein